MIGLLPGSLGRVPIAAYLKVSEENSNQGWKLTLLIDRVRDAACFIVVQGEESFISAALRLIYRMHCEPRSSCA